MEKIVNITLYGCAVKKTETKEGIELEIRAISPETGKMVDIGEISCCTQVDYFGNVTCTKIACTGTCEKKTEDGYTKCTCKK
jgi:hypothetical protein